MRGSRIGEASNPGSRRVRTIQPVGEDVVTSDSEDKPFVGVVAPSTFGAHHDFRVAFRVRDDPRKRMRLTADRQARVSEATTGEPINDTLLDALELDLSGPRRTGSDAPDGQVGINATPVDSDEEPLARFAATQQDAFVLCAESQSAVVDQDLGSSELDVPGLVEGRDVRPRRGTLKTPDDRTSPQEPEPVLVRPSRRVALVPQFSECTPQSRQDLGPSGSVAGTASSSFPAIPRRVTVAHHGTHPDQMEVAGPDTIPMNATSQELVNPTMVDLTVLDSASEVDDHVVPRRVRRLRIMGTQPTAEDPRESLPDPEFRVEERRTVPAVEFSLRGDYRAASESLDELDLNSIFEGRANVMGVAPFLMRGAFRGALRLATNEAVLAHNRNDVPREERAWKLFFLLPRMLLTRPSRGGKISPAKLEEKIARFTDGRWIDLVEESAEACAVARTAVVRKRRRHTDQDRKVARAERLVMLGELSSEDSVGKWRSGTWQFEYVESAH